MMPELGEIRQGYEIGPEKEHYHKFIWQACIKCGKERWVNMNTLKKSSGLCSSCSSKQCWITYKHPWIGNHHTEESKKKMSLSRLRLNLGREKSHLWKGGRGIETNRDYIWVYISSDDFFYPMARKGSGTGARVAEHRLVMAKHLGRCLLPWEVIHHKNGIKNDNRIENLELIKGQKNHLPSIHVRQTFNKLNNHIKLLEGKVTRLETENHLLKSQMIATKN